MWALSAKSITVWTAQFALLKLWNVGEWIYSHSLGHYSTKSEKKRQRHIQIFFSYLIFRCFIFYFFQKSWGIHNIMAFILIFSFFGGVGWQKKKKEKKSGSKAADSSVKPIIQKRSTYKETPNCSCDWILSQSANQPCSLLSTTSSSAGIKASNLHSVYADKTTV